MIYNISLILIVIGGLNWGLIGLTKLITGNSFDLVQFITNAISLSILGTIIYILVGVSAILVAFSVGKNSE